MAKIALWFSTPSAAIRGCVRTMSGLGPRANPAEIAVVAAMRKLLAAVWSVPTHRKPFVPHLPEVPARLGVLTNKA